MHVRSYYLYIIIFCIWSQLISLCFSFRFLFFAGKKPNSICVWWCWWRQRHVHEQQWISAEQRRATATITGKRGLISTARHVCCYVKWYPWLDREWGALDRGHFITMLPHLRRVVQWCILIVCFFIDKNASVLGGCNKKRFLMGTIVYSENGGRLCRSTQQPLRAHN